MSWTPTGRQRPRTGWRAAAYAAARLPGRWFPWRRLLWLACIAFSGLIIWAAGTHLGPALSAAHGNGTPGLWTAQQPGGSNGWTGEFVSTSGTDVRTNVTYTGSLPNVQAGTVVPALDAGASNEVYPLTGSSKWIRDLTGVIAGSLALIALLARGFYVARRRRRAPPGDYLTRAVAHSDYLTEAPGPAGRRLRRRVTGPQSRAGKLALFGLSTVVPAWIAGAFCALLADLQPYTGWYFPAAVAGGIVLAVGLPWALIAAFSRAATPGWIRWLLPGYVVALVGGMRFLFGLRFTPPPGIPPSAMPPPPASVVIEMVGLAAEALTLAAIAALMLAVTAEIAFPGPVGGWVRARRLAWGNRRELGHDHGRGFPHDREPGRQPDREPD